MRMIRIGLLSMLMAGVLVMTASRADLVPKAKASHACTVATLHGIYGGVWSGLLYPGPPPQQPQLVTAFQPYDGLEVATFDGAGNFSSSVTASVGGTPAQTFPDSGTYTVSPNCTGTLTLASGLTFDFIVLKGGKEVKYIDTDGSTPVAITETLLDGEGTD